MVSTLFGCAHQNVPVRSSVPATLSDNIQMPDLVGHYSKSLPIDANLLKEECIDRGRDVIVLVTAINAKNHEMDGIRKILSNPSS